ncbi:MAG: response regulator [Anaerolineae bacterium]|nr:response regulator [Anaerolineae bacterium]
MTLHILHLEDTKPLRDILRATLMAIRPGCEIYQFMTSDDAMDYIREYGDDIDLFLLDVRVPGSVDGLGVAEFIQEMEYRGLVVMTSAYMSPGRETLVALNAHWYQKPWQIEDVQEMLRLAASTRPTP